jgi:hypothetical protein
MDSVYMTLEEELRCLFACEEVETVDELDDMYEEYIMEHYNTVIFSNEEAEKWCPDIKTYRAFEEYYNENHNDLETETKKNFNKFINICVLMKAREAKVTHLNEYTEWRETMESDDEDIIIIKCILCGKNAGQYGNNAEPVAKGLCCDNCNYITVVPTRLAAVAIKHFADK